MQRFFRNELDAWLNRLAPCIERIPSDSAAEEDTAAITYPNGTTNTEDDSELTLDPQRQEEESESESGTSEEEEDDDDDDDGDASIVVTPDVWILVGNVLSVHCLNHSLSATILNLKTGPGSCSNQSALACSRNSLQVIP